MSEVDQFVSITGADLETARFYLQSSGDNLEVAVNNFFAEGTSTGVAAEPPQQEEAPVSSPAHVTQQSSQPAGTSFWRPVATGNVKGFADITRDEEDSDDDEEGNEYYAGGEKSGQVVRAPKDKDRQNPVMGFFDRARAAGAVDGRSEDLMAPSGRSGGAFVGAARRLDGEEVPSGQGNAPASPDPVVHTITFYANKVFTVDDGEPRSLTDPANRAFLESVSEGKCPEELEPPSRDTPVTVNLMRRDEDYVPPAAPRYVAFQGRGRTLAGTSSGDAAAAGPSAADIPSSSTSVAWEGIDEGAPSASIQLRLSDGSRMVARFNLTHTVADIRRFIRASRPDIPPTFGLFTAFPPKPLADDSLTIEAANLANAVVLQKP